MLERPILAVREPSLRRQKLALRLAFFVIIAVSLLAFYTTQRLIAASQRVEQVQGVLVDTNRFLSELKDVESAARGYLITGDGRYLQVHSASSSQARATEAQLLRLSPGTALGERLERLVVLADRRIELSRRVVAQRGSPAAALRDMAAGATVMDRLKADAAAIIANQSQNYRRERAALERQAWLTSIALAAGVALCLGIIAWLFALRGRELRRRCQLEDELRALNAALEDKVEERTTELSRARDLLDEVVENLPDMVLLKEAHGDAFRYVLINAAGERLLGRDRSEIIGRTERDLFPAEEAEMVVRTNKDVLDSGEPRVFTDRRMTTPGGVRTVETRMVPIVHGGSPGLLLAIVRDMTDAKSREDQIRLLQRMDAIGRLTGGVAHDFNNLLAIIHGNSELLLSRLNDQSDAKDMLEDVISASARGAELVRRLLAFARMQHLEPEPVDLNARLPGIVSLLQRALGEDIIVRLEPTDGLWPAIVDPTQVDDALVNLAINARDAMPEGGTLTIETRNVFLDEDYTAHHVEVAPGDLLLTDVTMPGGITGYDLAEQLRKDRSDLRVLFTSGYTELAAAKDGASRSGPLLSKPYRKQDLGAAVRAALDNPR